MIPLVIGNNNINNNKSMEKMIGIRAESTRLNTSQRLADKTRMI